MATILVVDDDAALRMLYEEELANEGWDIILAGSGEEALKWLSDGKPDVVVLDIRMEGIDGLETLQRIMTADKSIPVILNTAYGSYQDDFRTWAADAYIVKSSDLRELKTTIHKILQSDSADQDD
ncbi:MAG: response regulator [Candidatus Coatesbacteria bacterium]|nr:response regulator [Candidatus Coatesbacteria bacterium]